MGTLDEVARYPDGPAARAAFLLEHLRELEASRGNAQGAFVATRLDTLMYCFLQQHGPDVDNDDLETWLCESGIDASELWQNDSSLRPEGVTESQLRQRLFGIDGSSGRAEFVGAFNQALFEAGLKVQARSLPGQSGVLFARAA